MPPSLKGKILVLDTHAFIWFLADDPKLSDTAKAAIQEGLEQKALLALPSIVLAEVIDIVQKANSFETRCNLEGHRTEEPTSVAS